MMIETEICIGPIKKRDRVKLSYNKRQFYDRILTPMRAMGMIDYDLYKKKYVISHKFVNELNKIGMLWRKQPRYRLRQNEHRTDQEHHAVHKRGE